MPQACVPKRRAATTWRCALGEPSRPPASAPASVYGAMRMLAMELRQYHVVEVRIVSRNIDPVLYLYTKAERALAEAQTPRTRRARAAQVLTVLEALESYALSLRRPGYHSITSLHPALQALSARILVTKLELSFTAPASEKSTLTPPASP